MSFTENEKFFDYFAESLADVGKKIEVVSKTLDDTVKKVLEREVTVKNAEKMSISEVHKSISKIKEVFEELGIELGKEGKKFVKHFEDISIAQAKTDQGLSKESFQSRITNIGLPELFIKQLKALEKGDNVSYIKNLNKNDNAKVIADEIVKKLNLGSVFNTFGYKMKAFFGEKFDENKKALKGFAKDVVEGISSSKFVGGALGDLIKLAGLRFNSWTQGKGKLLETLGKIVVVLTQILSGILAGTLINNLLGGKLFGWAGNALKGFFKGGGFAKGASAIASFFSRSPKATTAQMTKNTVKARTVYNNSAISKWGKGVEDPIKAGGIKPLKTMAVKATAGRIGTGGLLATAGRIGTGAVRGIPGLIGSLAATPLANKAVSMGANAYVAHGLSGVAQGALFGAMFGPIGAGIGAAVGGIAGLIKGYLAKRNKEQDENKNFWQELFDMLKNSKLGQWLGLGGEGSSRGQSNSSVPEGAQKKGWGSERADKKDARTVGNLKIAKDGSVLNLANLTQDQASQSLQAYEKSDPTAFNNVYEWAGAGHASLASFQTDAVKKVNGKKTGALLYKGASSDLDALRKELIAKGRADGLSEADATKKANALMFTSGRMTGSNTRHSGKGKWKSHDNQYGLGFDLGAGGNWTQKDYDRYMSTVKQFYANKGFDVYYEKAGQGKSSGMHFDIKPHKNIRTPGAVKNLENVQEQQKAVAEKHSIDAMTMVKKLEGDEEFNKLGKANLNKSQEEFNKALDDRLKKYGITHMKDSKGGERWYYHDSKQNITREFDPTANLDFAKKAMTMTYMTNNTQ